jgi:putative heme-binding domain-containing protein
LNEPEKLVELSNHYSNAVRLGAVLALRRLEHEGIKAFLLDQNEYIVTEAARAINDDFSIEGALPELGNLLITTRFNNEPLIRRAINANLRVGTEQAMQNLIAYMLKPDAPLVLRQEAIEALGTWAKPSVLDRVDGRYRGEVSRDAGMVRAAAEDALLELLSSNQLPLKLGAIKAIGKLGIMETEERLYAMLNDNSPSEVKTAALQSLAKMQSEKTPQAIERAIADSDKNLRVAGLNLMDQLDMDKTLKVNLLIDIIEKRTTEEKQAALNALGNVPAEFSKSGFARLLGQMETGKLDSEILLELSEAVEKTDNAEIASLYQQAAEKLWKGDVIASYQSSLNGGDINNGRRLFFQSQTGQCMRCHAYDDMGGNVGPSMNGIALKLSRQELLESLIDPSRRIAPGYGIVTLEMENEKRVIGILAEENSQTLLISRGSEPDTLVRVSDVLERKNAPSSMPDMKNLLSRRQIRDLVAYLATLKDNF